MSLRGLIAAIVLNKTVCLPSVQIVSNAPYNASYEVQFCWDNEPGQNNGQDNTLIVTVTGVFD